MASIAPTCTCSQFVQRTCETRQPPQYCDLGPLSDAIAGGGFHVPLPCGALGINTEAVCEVGRRAPAPAGQLFIAWKATPNRRRWRHRFALAESCSDCIAPLDALRATTVQVLMGVANALQHMHLLQLAHGNVTVGPRSAGERGA